MPISGIGQDFVVNTTATEGQIEPQVTTLADGRFVVTWYSLDGGDGSGTCVRARIFNTDGSPAGNDFTIDNTTTGNQDEPSVTALANGGFVVTWSSADPGDGSGNCIRARFFDADGGATNATNDFVVNTTGTGTQSQPSVTTFTSGGFVVTWTSGDNGDGSGTCVRARIYGSDGGTAGGDFILNSTASGDQFAPSITALANGRFVATWFSSDTGDGSGSSIRARVFNANGSPVGNDFIVESTATGAQEAPTVTALADGRFVVTWASADDGDASGSCIRARIFNGNGSAVGKDFLVDTTGADDQVVPSIAALADGRFVLAWQSEDPADGDGTCIRARLYGVDGQAAGDDFIVNTTAQASQVSPSVSALADGRFVVTWTSGDDGDGSFTCIRARVFDPTVYSVTNGGDTWRGGNLADNITGGDGADMLFGLAGDDVISGDGGNDQLFGGDGKDSLFGGAGDDELNGDLGADTMTGGFGDDIFFVDNAGDKIVEFAGQGADRIYAAVSYTLAPGSAVEVLAAAGTAAINLTGNALANELSGNQGANVLNGGAGADVMEGSGGNDTYIVDNAGDFVSDSGGAPATGPAGVVTRNDVDKVISSISFSLADAAHVKGSVENLTLTGKATINGTGNALANVLIGNAANNVLSGAAGNDVLNGGAGNDRLSGGAGRDQLNGGSGNDVFLFDTAPNSSTNRDTIAGFANIKGNNDTIWLENAIFTKLGGGAAHGLNPAFFRVGAAAADANDYIVYNKATGALFYDATGSGAGGMVQIATLTNKPTLTANDFVVV
jgi:Ca2+-binding RTX toxin-like protein